MSIRGFGEQVISIRIFFISTGNVDVHIFRMLKFSHETFVQFICLKITFFNVANCISFADKELSALKLYEFALSQFEVFVRKIY